MGTFARRYGAALALVGMGLAATSVIAAGRGLATRMVSLSAGRFPGVDATLEIRSRRPVAKIQSDMFEVFEDGKRVEEFTIALHPARMRVTLVLDRSGSMGPAMGALKSAAWAFVRALPKTALVRVTSFADTARHDTKFTAARLETKKALLGLRPYGATALYDAILRGLEREPLSSSLDRRGLVVFTDGVDQNASHTAPQSTATAKQVVEYARKREVPLLIVGLGKEVNAALMQKMAAATGGRFLPARSAADLTRAFAAAKRALSAYYLLAYDTPNPARDGTLRKVKVRSRVLGFEDQAEGSYRAPRPAPPKPKDEDEGSHAEGEKIWTSSREPVNVPALCVTFGQNADDLYRRRTKYYFTHPPWADQGGSGEHVVHFEDGAVAATIPYVDGRPDGLLEFRYPTDLGGGVFLQQERFEGERHGRWIEFWPGGELSQEGTYEMGALHGIYRENYPPDQGGLLCEESEYRKGARHGLYRTFYPDGRPSIEATYVDGKKSGRRKEWFRNRGALFRDEIFVDDRKVSSEVRRRDGALYRKQWFGPQGQVLTEEEYLALPPEARGETPPSNDLASPPKPTEN